MRYFFIIITILLCIIVYFIDPIFLAILVGLCIICVVLMIILGLIKKHNKDDSDATYISRDHSEKKESSTGENMADKHDGNDLDNNDDLYDEDDLNDDNDLNDEDDDDDFDDDELCDGDELIDDNLDDDEQLDGMSFSFDSRYDYDFNDPLYDDEYGMEPEDADDWYFISEDRESMHLRMSSFYSMRAGEEMVLWKNGLYYPKSAIHEMPKSESKFLDDSAIPYKVPVRRRKKK